MWIPNHALQFDLFMTYIYECSTIIPCIIVCWCVGGLVYARARARMCVWVYVCVCGCGCWGGGVRARVYVCVVVVHEVQFDA